MKIINIEFAGDTAFNPELKVDGKKCKKKKVGQGRKVFTLETDKDELDIELYKWHEEESSLWLVMSLLFFIISIFGIFDIHQPRFSNSLKYRGKIKLDNTKEEYNTKIVLGNFKKDAKAFDVLGDQIIESNESNKYFVDELVETRKTKIRKIKKTIRILAFIIVILLLVLSLIF